MSLRTNLSNAFAKLATEIKATRALIGPLVNLTTANKDTIVNALNGLQTQVNNVQAAQANASGIDDNTIALTSTWSSKKTSDSITSAINALVNGAPAALDTLKELADQLTADQNSIGTITTALSNRLRIDAAQGLTAAQQQQGRDNLDVYSKAEIGDIAYDFVANDINPNL